MKMASNSTKSTPRVVQDRKVWVQVEVVYANLTRDCWGFLVMVQCFKVLTLTFFLKATPTHAPPHDFCRHKNSLVERVLATCRFNNLHWGWGGTRIPLDHSILFSDPSSFSPKITDTSNPFLER